MPYLALFGERTTVLIDTYDTVAAARAIVRARGCVRAACDSTAGISSPSAARCAACSMREDFADTRIFVSGDLDEHRIAQLLADAAPIDAFGVGTSLSTSSDAPALGGVYKLVEIERDGAWRPS